MNTGEFATRLAIWLALGGYAIGTGSMLRSANPTRGRGVWTFGCACYLVHVVCAFGFFHHWSHAAAYAETARQTRELVGWDWGGGVFVNYVFTLAWLSDVLWWWLAPVSHARRSFRATALLHGFFFFMVFNGTVVFGHGPVRWYGAAICVVVGCWWAEEIRRRRAAK